MKKKLVNNLWVEKYRPDTLDGYICNQETRDKFQKYIDEQTIPHLLFAGQAGTGKSTSAKLLINNISCDHIKINGSTDRGIEIIRTKVMNFVETSGFNNLKIILIEEADQLTSDAQDALRFITEEYSAHARFIMTCNNKFDISGPLRSRLVDVPLIQPTLPEIAKHLINILNQENVSFNIQDIGTIVKTYFPDTRSMVKILQDNIINNNLKLSTNFNNLSDLIENIINIINNNDINKIKFNNIRQLVNNINNINYNNLYTGLYENAKNIKKDELDVILIIADMIHKSINIPDPEINFMATILKIINL